MAGEDPDLLTNIRDLTTLVYVISRRKSSEWLESSMPSDLGIPFAKSSLVLAIRVFSFCKHCFWYLTCLFS